MQRLEVIGAVRPIYGSLGVKRLIRSVILLVAKCAKYCVHSRSLFLMIMVLVIIDTET